MVKKNSFLNYDTPNQNSKCKFLLATYEGSIGFVSRKMKKKKIANFHVLGFFMAKIHD
jgi:hypothetical protein